MCRVDHSSRGVLPSVMRTTKFTLKTSKMKRPRLIRVCYAMREGDVFLFDVEMTVYRDKFL